MPAVAADQGATRRQYTAEDYARADQFRFDNVRGTVRNQTIHPHWIGDADEFWYRRDTADGHEFVIIDAETGERQPAFDHQILAKTLSETLDEDIQPSKLPFEVFEFGAGRSNIQFQVKSQKVSCDLSRGSCRAEPQAPPTQGVLVFTSAICRRTR